MKIFSVSEIKENYLIVYGFLKFNNFVFSVV